MLGESKRRERPAVVGAPPWMATFADLSTLLLSFFVLLLSFSEMDVEKYKQIAGSLRNAFGVQREQYARDTPMGTSFVAREFAPAVPDPKPINQIQQQTTLRAPKYLESGPEQSARRHAVDAREPPRPDLERLERVRSTAEKIRRLLHSEIKRGLVEVIQDGYRIVIRIRERGFFPSGRAELLEPFTPVIRKIATAIGMVDGEVLLAGHTDNVPIATARFRSNWELSAARAVTLLHRMQAVAPIDVQRITVEGHADTRPLAPNDSPLNRARNRRVEVILVDAGGPESERGVEQVARPAAAAGEAPPAKRE